MKRAIVVSGGNSYKDIIEKYIEDYYIVAVDSGMNILDEMKISPDLLVGDFDSIDKSIGTDIIENKSIEIVKRPVEKDETDTEIAIDILLEKGFKEIVLLGATGTRIDHTLANINLLSKIKNNNAFGRIIDANNIIEIGSDNIVIQREYDYKYLSLLPFGGKVKGISLKGFKYNAESLDMDDDSVIGISNEIISDRAEISIKKGKLLIIKSRD
ncbi:MAG: thiamine diphosphokinase [Andreesenia angusta]|nr:thiamine diphosphokinase [Andreesenia angusta]